MLQTLNKSLENSSPVKVNVNVKATIKCCICAKSEKAISVTWLSKSLSVPIIKQILESKQPEESIGHWNMSNFKRHINLKHKIDNMAIDEVIPSNAEETTNSSTSTPSTSNENTMEDTGAIAMSSRKCMFNI